MLPLIPLAVSLATEFLPSMVSKIFGDKTGRVAETVISAAAEMTGVAITSDVGVEHAADVLRNNPELMVQFQTRMAEIELEETKAYLGDVQSARKRDTDLAKAGKTNYRADVMVAGAFMAITVIAVFLIMREEIDAGVMAFLTTIGGMLMKNISTAFDFEFGSSRSSKGKSEDMGNLMKLLSKKG